MKYVLLKENVDKYQEGDEYRSPVTGIWGPIPKQWYGMVHSYDGENTMSRMKIPVRRPVNSE